MELAIIVGAVTKRENSDGILAALTLRMNIRPTAQRKNMCRRDAIGNRASLRRLTPAWHATDSMCAQLCRSGHGPACVLESAQQKTGRSRAKKTKKRIEGQREMLLPIAGKKGKESAVKPVRAGGKQRKAG